MNNLKQLREEAGLSLSQLGRLCGKSKAHMWELEKEASNNPTLKTAYALANVLEVDVYDIWPDTTEIEVEKVEIRRVKN